MKTLSACLLIAGLTIAGAAAAEPFNDRSEPVAYAARPEPIIGSRSDRFNERGDDYLSIQPAAAAPAWGDASITTVSVHPVTRGNS